MTLRRAAARILSSRSRRLKLTRSTISATKTPALNVTQNQILVATARTVSCREAHGNRKPHSAFQFSLEKFAAYRRLCDRQMDAELEKLVEAGRLTSKAAERLEKLRPGTFCLHKSWGFGRVAAWNLLLNQIVIDFAGKKSHP